MERQASEALAEAKLRSELYNQRFKNTFKEGTNLLSKQITGKDTATSSFSVDKLVADLNQKFNLLKGNKKLSKTTLYWAVCHGKVGKSPMMQGPAPKMPDILLDVTSLHTEASQVAVVEQGTQFGVGSTGQHFAHDVAQHMHRAVWLVGAG